MKHIVIVALAAVIAQGTINAHAGDMGDGWFNMADAPNRIAAIQTRTASKTAAGYVRVWVKTRTDDKDQSIALDEFDCDQQRARILQATNYRLDGTVIASLGAQPWEFVAPSTIMEGYMNVVCDPKVKNALPTRGG